VIHRMDLNQNLGIEFSFRCDLRRGLSNYRKIIRSCQDKFWLGLKLSFFKIASCFRQNLRNLQFFNPK
jgi:hypothetical protein